MIATQAQLAILKNRNRENLAELEEIKRLRALGRSVKRGRVLRLKENVKATSLYARQIGAPVEEPIEPTP